MYTMAKYTVDGYEKVTLDDGKKITVVHHIIDCTCKIDADPVAVAMKQYPELLVCYRVRVSNVIPFAIPFAQCLPSMHAYIQGKAERRTFFNGIYGTSVKSTAHYLNIPASPNENVRILNGMPMPEQVFYDEFSE